MVPMEQMQEPIALTRMDRERPTSVMEMEMAAAMTSASVAVKLGMFFFSSSTFMGISFGILTCYKSSPSRVSQRSRHDLPLLQAARTYGPRLPG